MKTLKDFLNDISTNEQLGESFESFDSITELCNEANKRGYNFSEDELTEYYLDAVAGGAFIDNTTTIQEVVHTSNINGNNNFLYSTLNVDFTADGTAKQNTQSIDKLAVLSMLLGRQ